MSDICRDFGHRARQPSCLLNERYIHSKYVCNRVRWCREVKGCVGGYIPNYVQEYHHYMSVIMTSCLSRSNSIACTFLCELASDSAGHSKGGVDVNLETSWVVLNLGNVEGSAGVTAVSAVKADHEWSLEASNAVGVAGVTDWVGESDSGWAGLASDSLVHVCGSSGQGLVVASETDEGDVEADGVGVSVQAQVVVADRAGETTGRGGAVDNLVRCSDNVESGGEGEWAWWWCRAWES